jgi:hypothetical protein
MAFLDFINQVPSLIQAYQGASKISKGYELQAGAAQMAALGFRQAGSATTAIANYNIELDRQQTAKQLDVFSRQIHKVSSTQIGQMSRTGVALGSKSFLAVQAATLDNANRQIVQMKDAQQLMAQQRLFEAKQSEVDFENRARAAEYQSEVFKWQSSQNQSNFFQTAFSSVLGSLGDML